MATQADSPQTNATTPSSAPSSEQKSCWECSRRRLVCDETHPTCRKCRDAGIVCPGYSSAKPLRWLAPGRVNARVRRKPKRKGDGSATRGTATSTDAVVSVNIPSSSSSSSSGSEERMSMEYTGLSQHGVSAEGSSEIEAIHRPSIPRMTGYIQRPLLQGLFVSDETEIVQAAYYYNYHVFPEFDNKLLAPTIFITPVPLEVIRFSTPAMMHILVSIAVRHRIYRVASNSGVRDDLVKLRSKFYDHRGKAIASLNHELRNVRNPYILMISAVMFVFAELQHSSSQAWKVHLDALMGMVSRGGGMSKICAALPGMNLTMILCIMIHVTGGTTSPPSSSTLKDDELEGLLQYTAEAWEGTPYPSFMCPTPILHAIIRINYLRTKLLEDPICYTGPDPEQVLSELRAFSPEAWAASKESANENWLLITRAHHSAAILYCIGTLGAHFPSPALQYIEILRAVHSSELIDALRESNDLESVRIGTMWPLIVASVEVAKHDVAMRSLVRKRYDMLSDDMATPLMVEAKGVFERFWALAEGTWDDCFVRPYAFVM